MNLGISISPSRRFEIARRAFGDGSKVCFIPIGKHYSYGFKVDLAIVSDSYFDIHIRLLEHDFSSKGEGRSTVKSSAHKLHPFAPNVRSSLRSANEHCPFRSTR